MKIKHHHRLHYLCILTFVILRCRFVSRIILSGCLAALGSSFVMPASAQVPNLVSYQGRVAVGTVNFEGTGQFRFALVNAAGTTVYWGNAADTTPADGVPDTAVSLTVTKGLYSVLLGDTSIANMAAIPASVWTNADVRLRVWFNDGVNGSQLLTPDQRIAPNGYLPDGSVSSTALANGAVTTAKMAAGSVTSTQLGANAVQSANIATGAVSSSQIAAGAVTNAQMAAGAITGANLATQSRSGTMLDGVLSFSTPGSVSVPIVFSPALRIAPTLSQTPGGWTLGTATPTGFTASAPFTPFIVDSTGDVGQSTTVVQTASGRPAISYHDITSGTVKFAIAANADGSGGWTTVTVDTANTSTPTPFSMAILGGVPCIAYRQAPGDDLAFARASSADGSGVWTITVVDTVGNVGAHCSLTEVSGRPAISYRGQTEQELKYAISPNANGTGAWTVVTVDSVGNTGTYTSLAVVNGRPAISYYDDTNDDLKFVRATDATGGAWGTPTTLDSTGAVGSFASMKVVDGRPAISYYDVTNQDLKYIRASDADGSAWNAPVTVDSPGNVGQFTSLAVLNGRPAISYFGATTQDLKLAYAATADGSGAWTSVVMDAVGNIGRHASLAQMSGGLAISYYDTNNQDLKYAAIPALNWAASEFGTAGPIAATSFSGNGSALTNLSGGNLTAGSVGGSQLATGAVDTAKIANNAVTSVKLANNAVQSANIADGAVSNVKLATNAVQAANIADGAVTSAKLDSNIIVSGSNFGLGHKLGLQEFATYIDVEGVWLGSRSNDPVHLYTNDSAYPNMTLATNGNVGIASYVPQSILDIAPATNSTDGIRIGKWADTASRFIGITNQAAGFTFPTTGGFSGIEFGGPSSAAEGFLAFHTHDTGSASGERMRIDNVGNVGIGTATPNAKLTVIGSQATGVFNASYLAYGGGSFAPAAHGVHNMSIYADKDIMGLGFYALSDERIKNIRGQSDGAADLHTLRNIRITDYRFKDEIGQGSGQQKKVIAQQVEKVFPQAVNQHTGVVPDIFKRAAIQDGWVTLKTEVKKGDRVRLISEKGDAIHEVLEVKKDSFRTDFKGESKEVFVYGREVKDVRAVDYEAISMLNVSATQELARKVEAQDTELAALKKQLADQAAAIKTLAAKQAERDEALEARLAALERAAPSNAVKVAMKK